MDSTTVMESAVLIEAESPYAITAQELLAAAHFKPVMHPRAAEYVRNILHQIDLTPEQRESRPIAEVTRWVCGEVTKTVSRHRNRYVVFCLPQMTEKRFVSVCADFWNIRMLTYDIDFSNTISDAVARFIQRKQAKVPTKPASSLQLDTVPGIDAFTADLRSDATGRVNAAKIVELFGVSLTSLAKAAGVSKQALAQTPDSEKAQPILRLFERLARLRSHPQFAEPTALRKWFRKPMPIFSNHSAEELFDAGKLAIAAEKVDQLLIGDFGG